MSKRDKLRRKLRNNPKGVKFHDLRTLLDNFGFILIRISGSHHIYSNEVHGDERNITIPVHGSNVKPIYVTEVIQMIDEVFPDDSIGETDDDKQND